MNRPAFHDTLGCLSQAVHCAATGRPEQAEAAFLEASIAAAEAFPEGSRAVEALNVLLAEAGADMGGVTT